MGDVVKVLYERFLMRDLLGKVGPGFVAVAAVLTALQINIPALLPDEKTLWLLWVAAIPILFLAGLALQILGERLGVHSASPRPRYYLYFFSTRGRWREANQDFDRRVALFRNIPPPSSTADAQAQRERFVYLKEGSGNMGLAILVALICLLTGGLPWTDIRCVLLLVLSFVLFTSHCMHARRQALFEIHVLNGIQTTAGIKLLSDTDAQAMLDRIGGGRL
jgi:hypothetical protein